MLTNSNNLEQRIAELEAPKTCDGCLHLRMKNVPHSLLTFLTIKDKIMQFIKKVSL